MKAVRRNKGEKGKEMGFDCTEKVRGRRPN